MSQDRTVRRKGTRMRGRLLLALVGVALSAGAQTPAQLADRIFVNGKIWTADEARPTAQAIAVSGDKILAVGSSQQVRALAGPKTVTVDLGGRLMVPGFIDSHTHFPGTSINHLKLDGIETLEGFQKSIADFAKSHPKLKWIAGAGWVYSGFPNQTVDKKYIDAVVSDRPVYVLERDGHMGLANSKALELAGITRDTKDPPNGHIMRDAKGEPTGELKESAQSLVRGLIPADTPDEVYRSFLKNMDEAASDGLTGAQNASWSPEDQPILERALREKTFKLRIRFAPMILPKDGGSPKGHYLKTPLTAADLAEYKRLREAFKGPILEFGSIKGFLDGTVDAQTAAMFDPYVGTKNTGIPFWEQDDLNKTVALYDKEGFQVLLHAIGDKAINMALNSFEYAAKVNGTKGRRHRVEHGEVPRLSDLPRFKQLGVIVSTQQLMARPDATELNNYAVLLGPERASHALAFKLYDDAGAVQAFGSDWVGFDMAPLLGIHVAVTRLTPEGTPKGGWYPENRVSVEAALRHYTRDGAYATFNEQNRGTLTAGKLADFVVLSKDVLTIAPMDILKTKVLLTVMGGRDTYRDRDFQ